MDINRRTILASGFAAIITACATRLSADQADERPSDRLSPSEERSLNKLLIDWQKSVATLRAFVCNLRVFEKNSVLGKNEQTLGYFAFEAPNRFKINIAHRMVGDESQKIQGMHWTCDGKTFFDVRHDEQSIVEYQLPPNALQLGWTPIPYLFRTNAGDLQRRFVIRENTTPHEQSQGEHWLAAWPRLDEQSAWICKSRVILKWQQFAGVKRLLPYGLNLLAPNDAVETSYIFEDYRALPMNCFGPPRWRPNLPGYQRIVSPWLFS